MEDEILIGRVKPNEQEYFRKGNFLDEAWWKHPETIKACHFHLRPSKNEYGSISKRLWQNIGACRMLTGYFMGGVCRTLRYFFDILRDTDENESFDDTLLF